MGYDALQDGLAALREQEQQQPPSSSHFPLARLGLGRRRRPLDFKRPLTLQQCELLFPPPANRLPAPAPAAKGKGKAKSKATASASSSGGGGGAAGGGGGGAGTKKKGAGGDGGRGGDGKGKPPRVPTMGKATGKGQASTAATAARGQQQQLSEEAQLAAALASIAEEGESGEGLGGSFIAFNEERGELPTPHGRACTFTTHTEAAGRRNPRRQARPQRGALLESTEWVLYSS